MDLLVFDVLLDDDELDALEIAVNGIPRRVYERSDHFHNLDDLGFYRRFRLTKETVLYLLDIIQDRLEFPFDMNQCVSPINQLLTCLRFYATGTHLLSIADFAGMHVSTVCRIVKRVSEAIAAQAPRFIKFSNTEDAIRRTQNKFFNIASFPRVIGAIDCTHIKIESVGGNNAEIFRNRKQYFSINVQAICNADLEITNIVARWPGSAHDSTIFSNSNIRGQFEAGVFPNSLLLGDSGYGLRPYLMTPLSEPVTEAQQLYNEAHIRTRNTIERCFGVWKRRFPVLAYGSRLKLENTLTVIVATAVLHNVANVMGDVEPPPPEEDIHRLDDLIRLGQVPNLHRDQAIGDGVDVRAEFINNYFANL